ncbi:hypothetical protein BPSOL_0421 [Bifidobacterium pseudolongum]|nr:hypothetical protein BPSOL_0421 [Bifidobacterium pseudolongum]
MQGAGDTHRSHSRSRNRAQEGAAQRVAKRIAEPRFERLDDETGTLRVQGFLGKCRTLCDKHCGYPFSFGRWCTHRSQAALDGWGCLVLRRDDASEDERR